MVLTCSFCLLVSIAPHLKTYVYHTCYFEDEATSALDSESEKSVQKAIENLLKTKREEMTTLIIAHRLSTVKNADKIFVIDSGFVVEEGSHDDLMENESGIYFKMIHHSLH